MNPTFVVATVDGTWAMGCCDDMHGMYDMPDAEFTTRREAEAAARAHRAEDAEERQAYEARVAQCCPACMRPR